MKFVAFVVLLGVISGYVSSSAIQRANDYMDKLLGHFLQDEDRSPVIENIPVANFNITVKSNFISNRDILAQFTHGRITGLSKIRRDGDCKPSKWVSGNITLECRLNLTPVQANYAAEVRGHTLTGSPEFFDFFVRVRRCTATFVAQSKPNKPAVIKTSVIDEPMIVEASHLTYQAFGLNEGRSREFYQQLENYGMKHIRNGFAVNFVRMLNRILQVNADLLLLPTVEIYGD
ncbi:uncharacterized protein LOC100902015 [Galendromus occidentalis]|uniref:Uncharacterized protein LOC100902015 n=1 Tax=Galendromus occidentalis TaxID=34638 RepID=A0AAJ6VXS0_9ACAR|nr:uncharacterized protein LOC100902015 [Galendromus occidentalis]